MSEEQRRDGEASDEAAEEEHAVNRRKTTEVTS